MTGHVHEWNNAWENFIYDARIFLSDTNKHSKAVVRAYEESTGYKCCVQELRHRSLGGIAGDRLNLIWRSDDGYKQLGPGTRRLELRQHYRKTSNIFFGVYIYMKCPFLGLFHKNESEWRHLMFLSGINWSYSSLVKRSESRSLTYVLIGPMSLLRSVGNGIMDKCILCGFLWNWNIWISMN